MKKISITELESYYNLLEKLLNKLFMEMSANPNAKQLRDKYLKLLNVYESFKEEIYDRLISISEAKNKEK